jgi:predicted ester cyclase
LVFVALIASLRPFQRRRVPLAGDHVVAHLHFWGHFNGAFGQKQGAAQTVDFIATDILRVQDGRITDNWHIEDNLTLMQQLGIVQP